MFNHSKNILKFFYLLDPDILLKRIVTKLEEKRGNYSECFAQDIFFIIYSEITKYCSAYTDFITSLNSFNAPERHNATSSWYMLIDNVLQNHCILNGFLTSLKIENHESTIKLCGKNDLQLKTGYFKTNCFSDKPELLPNGNKQFFDIHQRYYQHKKYFSKNYNDYAYQYLLYDSLIENSSETMNNYNFLDIPPYNGNWGCFIYTNSEVRLVNSSIANSSNHILTNYDKLYEKCLCWMEDNHLSPDDKFLFEHAMESMYGFSFFNYVAKLLNIIHNTLLDDSKMTLKDLEGSVLLSYVQKIAQLPITYNRSVFLGYIIHKVISSKYLNSHDFTPNGVHLFSNVSSIEAPKEQLITNGLELAGNYLQKLKYVALPLLEDMWNVIVEDLNNLYLKGKGCPITIKTYQTYIEKNYDAITKDYSHYFNDSRPDLTMDSLISPNIKSIPHLYQDFNYTYALGSKFERESFNNLLFDYCKTKRFSQPKIADLLLPYIPPNIALDEISAHTNELNFHKNHSNNILSFAENIIYSK